MKVTAEQVAKGLASYVDRELVPQVPGLRKWGLGFMGGHASVIVQNMAEKHRDMLKMLGIMDEDGMIDIDMLASEMKRKAAELGPVTEHLPIFGDVTFNSSDVDKLHTYIIN